MALSMPARYTWLDLTWLGLPCLASPSRVLSLTQDSCCPACSLCLLADCLPVGLLEWPSSCCVWHFEWNSGVTLSLCREWEGSRQSIAVALAHWFIGTAVALLHCFGFTLLHFALLCFGHPLFLFLFGFGIMTFIVVYICHFIWIAWQ